MVGKGTYRTKEEKVRIVMEVLSNSSTIWEICKKYNVASSAIYKWRDEFIAGGQPQWNMADPPWKHLSQERTMN